MTAVKSTTQKQNAEKTLNSYVQQYFTHWIILKQESGSVFSKHSGMLATFETVST